ncbi:MAG: GntR family transcriptional regulator [Solirubrobacterales bacterium]|nr:GntR family transcriptional regulator [Solirubrobacterales bacterium]
MSEPSPSAGPRPVTNQTRRDAVVQELRRAIMAGELAAGQRVREVHVAQQMGISRPTLREAISQLIHDGLLEQEPYRGVVVAAIDAKFVTDMASVRVALETLAGQAIATDPDGSARETVKRAWHAYQEAHGTRNPERLHEAHLDLHRSIWFASGNALLKRIWSTMEAQINAAISIDEDARADPERDLHVHERLIDAIFSGDPDVIEAEVERHTKASADELIRMIAERDRRRASSSP